MLVKAWIEEIEKEKKKRDQEQAEQDKEQKRYGSMMNGNNFKNSMPKMPSKFR